jgi:hypothetical protein
MQPGEILQVGPYRVQLVEITDDKVVVRTVFKPSPLHKQAATKVISAERYLELRKLAEAWESLSTEVRVMAILNNGFDPTSELMR